MTYNKPYTYAACVPLVLLFQRRVNSIYKSHHKNMYYDLWLKWLFHGIHKSLKYLMGSVFKYTRQQMYGPGSSSG